MGRYRFRLLVLVLLAFVNTACTKDLKWNTDKEGPFFVKVEPEPEPQPEPEPEPEPVVEEPSLTELNERALQAFDDLGFDAEINDKGVTVYLPPSIYFKGSASTISLPARTKIAEVAQELKKEYLAQRIIEVAGHTDSVGDEEINLQLSKQRSLAATEELIFSGIKKTRISSVWFGETRPRFNERNADGSINREQRNRNRRVDFTVLNPTK